MTLLFYNDFLSPQSRKDRYYLFLSGHYSGQEGAVLIGVLNVKRLTDGVLIADKQQMAAVKQHVGHHKNDRIETALLSDGAHGVKEFLAAIQKIIGIHAGYLAYRKVVTCDVEFLIIVVQHCVYRFVLAAVGGEDGLAQLIKR